MWALFSKPRIRKTRSNKAWHCRVRFKAWKPAPSVPRLRRVHQVYLNLSGTDDFALGPCGHLSLGGFERVVRSLVLAE
jgi:hypothetical protein